jgi:hypothetical protein
MQVKIDFNPNQIKRIRDKVKIGVEGGSREGVKAIVDNTKMLAKFLAPKKTGNVASFIRGKVEKNAKGYTGSIVAENPTANGQNRYYPQYGKYPDFNLTRWMHLTGGKFKGRIPMGLKRRQHITGGDPYFMYTAAEQVRRDAKRTITNKIKIR